ncbi:regulation of nuclear pre-mRNA domain-containing protein 1A isoform X3 [Chelonia mydas]|uniref:regulation of nuclear pre-mRNA domain-containing protein 1A isoform X3 n=1 Tax=Chelonia mydas TaxID=8469 RepID=UPI000FFC6B9A|nr:regulation of nuclear pre-mRNA domain-containing protein 1A isoform X3 [Chelonia mydas]
MYIWTIDVSSSVPRRTDKFSHSSLGKNRLHGLLQHKEPWDVSPESPEDAHGGAHHNLAKPNRKLTFLYLANDVIQNSKRKGPEFTKDFAPVIVEAFKHVSSESDESCKKHLGRVLSIWEERSVYENDVLEQLRQALYGDRKARKRTFEQIKVDENNCSAQSSPSDPPQTTDLIRALQELENAASGDAAVHQRIASLPVEVQDVSLLDRITDKESGEQLSKMVDDACMVLADYNGRLAAEIDDRKQLTRMLSDFLRCQKEVLAEKEHKLEEYKRKLARVSQVRKELRSRIQNLPDLSRLPNVTGSHVHLPFAGDIYSDD